MKRLLLACALAISACDAVTDPNMPNMEDPAALRAAALKLSPIAPGGPPNDTGLYGTGQPGSDRYLFIQRLKRWADEDSVRRMNIDYKEEPLPRTIAQAIEEQREYEAAREARSNARLKASRAADAEADARRAAEARAHEAARANEAAANEKAAAEASRRYDAAMTAYQECRRLRELPDSPEVRGIYPEKNCEQLQDEALAGATPE